MGVRRDGEVVEELRVDGEHAATLEKNQQRALNRLGEVEVLLRPAERDEVARRFRVHHVLKKGANRPLRNVVGEARRVQLHHVRVRQNRQTHGARLRPAVPTDLLHVRLDRADRVQVHHALRVIPRALAHANRLQVHAQSERRGGDDDMNGARSVREGAKAPLPQARVQTAVVR